MTVPSDSQSPASRILAFYRGEGTDHVGRTWDSIIAFDFDRLDCLHDFIQWLFPLPEESPVNPAAPVLTAEAIDAFRMDADLRRRLRRSLDRMLEFYGLALVPNGEGCDVTESAAYVERSNVWVREHNHNHLRLTRILRACRLLGLLSEAEALARWLDDLAERLPRTINRTTRQYWHRAAQGLP